MAVDGSMPEVEMFIEDRNMFRAPVGHMVLRELAPLYLPADHVSHSPPNIQASRLLDFLVARRQAYLGRVGHLVPTPIVRTNPAHTPRGVSAPMATLG